MLKPFYSEGTVEAGCDEAGRGCLAGPVYAAAAVLPADFSHPLLNDSKKMTARNRDALRAVIEREAAAWAVAAVSPARIDLVNILNASFEAMTLAVRGIMGRMDANGSHAAEWCVADGDSQAENGEPAADGDGSEATVVSGGRRIVPELLLIDGNRFRTALDIPYRCVVGGDGLYASIAAASVLAKTHRDECMERLAARFPEYGWAVNKGYPTRAHRAAISQHGLSPHHRRTFRSAAEQPLKLF